MISTKAYYPILAIMALLVSGCSTTGGPRGEAPAAPVKVSITLEARADFARALKAMKAKKYDTTERLFSLMTKKYPKLSGPYANLGIIFYKTEKFDKALPALKKAVALNPNRALTHNYLGMVYRGLGRFGEARQAYSKAISLAKDYANAHLNIGILYDLYLLDYSRALKHYEKFQSLSANKDKQVSIWIVDLKRRMKSPGPIVGKVSQASVKE